MLLQDLEDEEDIAEFWRLAEKASTRRLYCPARCSKEAAPMFGDLDSKFLYLMGGSQGGKTQTAAELLFSRMLIRGGKGARFVWVAYTRQTTQVGVDKLARGYQGDRYVPPVIPPEFVLSYPKNEHQGDQMIRLIDGTLVDLRFASRDGDNIKGIVAIDAVFDEATACKHEINFTILAQRMATTGGQLFISSTPKDPHHWLRKRSEAAPRYDDPDLSEQSSGSRKIRLSCRTNPWVLPEDVDNIVQELGGPDDPRVQREVEGRWVGEGERLYRHFDRVKHCVPWASRKVEQFGYVDLTNSYGATLFQGMSTAKVFPWIGGQDFNANPFSLGLAKIICRKEDDQRDPNNHVLYIDDCIVKRSGSATEFGEFVRTKAHVWRGRGLDKGSFEGLHIICDKTGFHKHTRDRSVSARADASQLEDEGFVCRAPIYYKGSNAANPPRRVRHALLNELMFRGKFLVNESRCAELIESLETEEDDGTGDTKKAPNTVSDRISGITDGVGYVAYAALFDRLEVAREQTQSDSEEYV